MTHEQTDITSVVEVSPFGTDDNQVKDVIRTSGQLFLPVRVALELTKREMAWDEWEQMLRRNTLPGSGEHRANQRKDRTKDISYGVWVAAPSGEWPYSTAHQEARAQQYDIIQHLVSTIDTVAKQAAEANWDGEDALPVAPETEQIAKDLVRIFPAISKVPDVSASPNGEIDFDWAIERHVMLTVSVCGPPEHYIMFVANMEKSEFRGKEPWDNKLPQLVKCCFERMKGWL